MLAYTYIEQGKFELLEKQRPQIKDSRDAIIFVSEFMENRNKPKGLK